MLVHNFGRNLEFSPQAVHAPASEAELLEILRKNRGHRIRAIGRLHSWSEAAVADDVLLDLRNLNEVRVERRGEQTWAIVGGGCQIKRVLSELDRHGLTLPTLGLISEQTIAGAAATGTHGSGRHSLSHYLDEVRVAAYDEADKPVIRTIDSGDELRAARCSLGCLGIVVSVAFRCRPQYRIEEHFREYETLEEVLAAEEQYPLTQFYLVPWRWKWMAQHRRESDAPRSWLAPLYRLYWFLWIDVSLHLIILLLVRWLRSAALLRLFYRWVVPLAIVRPWRVVDRSQDMLVMEHELFRHIEIEIFVRRSVLQPATEFLQQTLRQFAGEKLLVPRLLPGNPLSRGSRLARHRRGRTLADVRSQGGPWERVRTLAEVHSQGGPWERVSAAQCTFRGAWCIALRYMHPTKSETLRRLRRSSRRCRLRCGRLK